MIKKGSSLMASASRIIMDKQQQQQPLPPPPAALNCPRCDSSNTKFCYYNNYSLSQPRHFCKACKRYWTRGGTLRNVPVGGGCRKNKRLKTNSSSSSAVNATATSTPTQNPRLIHNSTTTTNNNIISSSSPSNLINSSMFFGLDAHLGFSSSSALLSHMAAGAGDLRQGFNSNHFHPPAISFDRNSQLLGNFETSNLMTPRKEVKMEGLSRLRQNQTEQIDLSNFSDPSHYWNSATGNWHDPTNNGSSIASLF